MTSTVMNIAHRCMREAERLAGLCSKLPLLGSKGECQAIAPAKTRDLDIFEPGGGKNPSLDPGACKVSSVPCPPAPAPAASHPFFEHYVVITQMVARLNGQPPCSDDERPKIIAVLEERTYDAMALASEYARDAVGSAGDVAHTLKDCSDLSSLDGHQYARALLSLSAHDVDEIKNVCRWHHDRLDEIAGWGMDHLTDEVTRDIAEIRDALHKSLDAFEQNSADALEATEHGLSEVLQSLSSALKSLDTVDQKPHDGGGRAQG